MIPVVESAADALVIGELARIRRCADGALPARVLRRHEERSPPLVRHGDVRQPREGRAAPRAHAPGRRRRLDGRPSRTGVGIHTQPS